MTNGIGATLRSIWLRIDTRALVVAFVCAWIALAPSLAEARAGGGSSFGSRGARTYNYNGGQSMQRSLTPRPAPSEPQFAPQPGFAQPYGYGGFAQRHPFMTGLFGGFLGAGIAGMLFGHSAWAADMSPVGSFFGMLLQFALIGGLVWLAVGFFRRRSAPAFGGAGYATPQMARTMPQQRSANPVEIPISDADFNAWTGILTGVQQAWSHGDLAGLRRYVTPEMLSYFADELSRNASQGVENRVEDVDLLKGDLVEAWEESGLQYATTRLSWRARDYMVPVGSRGGQEVIVAGDPARPVEATELWTFMRSRSGQWLLSAIQQAS